MKTKKIILIAVAVVVAAGGSEQPGRGDDLFPPA